MRVTRVNRNRPSQRNVINSGNTGPGYDIGDDRILITGLANRDGELARDRLRLGEILGEVESNAADASEETRARLRERVAAKLQIGAEHEQVGR